MAIEVREARTAEEREAVYRLRYEVFVAEMGYRPPHADHKRTRFVESQDALARLIIACDGPAILGCFRISLASEGGLEQCAWLYRWDRFEPWFPKHVSTSSKFIVSPRARATMLAGRLFRAGYQFYADHGIQFDAICCRPHLTPFYGRIGYRPYLPPVVHPEAGEVVPMVLACNDRDYLRSIDSPARAWSVGELVPGALRFLHTRLLPVSSTDAVAQTIHLENDVQRVY